MGNWKQILGVAYLGLLVVAGALAAALPAAKTPGDRWLHALFGVLVVGVAAVAILFPIMFVLAAREARASRRGLSPH